MITHLSDEPDQPREFTPAAMPWRVGRSVGRTVYVQTGDGPAKTDVLVGVMDTRELAALVVRAVNLMHGVTDSPPRPDLTPDPN